MGMVAKDECIAQRMGKEIWTGNVRRRTKAPPYACFFVNYLRKRSPKSKTPKIGQVVSWSHDTKGHAENCVESFGELAHKSVEQL